MIIHKVLVKAGVVEERKLTPIKSIRLKCLECSNWQPNEVSTCQMDDCPLWVFRSGKNPAINRGKLSEEQKSGMIERLKAYRELKNVQRS